MATPSMLIVPDRYKSGVLYSQLPESGAVDFDVVRATTAYRTNASGILESVASGVPRLDYPAAGGCPSLLVEPAATNQIRNNSMQGAVTGTPGTLPTNWFSDAGGLDRDILSIGVENGIDYIDVKFSGTATGSSCNLFFESITQIVAATSQTWVGSFYIKRIAAPLPEDASRIRILGGTAGGTTLEQQFIPFTISSTLERKESPRTFTNASTVRAGLAYSAQLTIGQAYDFTIRIGWPQMEQGSVATSPIRTTTAAATRNADVISKTGVSGFIGQTEGAVAITVNLTSLSGLSTRYLFNFIIDDNNRLGFRFLSTTSCEVAVRTGGTNFGASFSFPAISTGLNNIIIQYTTTDIKAIINGIVYTSTSARTYPSLNNIVLGAYSATILHLNDRIRAAAIYTTRLSNSELAALTSL
jgi:hypothetical protein